jgi:protein-S-isoprenylcysteine O-methyltransferase Ste14
MPNNKMQRTKRGLVGASPLILVFGRPGEMHARLRWTPEESEPNGDRVMWRWGDVLFYFALLLFALWKRPHSPTLVAAVVLATVAFPLWIIARVQLGSAFSFRAKAHHLVTTGLYSRIRHPVYLFGGIAGLASVLALQVWWILLLALLLEPITIIRAIQEERVLQAVFGEEYMRYRERTWF